MNESVKLTRDEIWTLHEALHRARERIAQNILTWTTLEQPGKIRFAQIADAEYLRLIEKLRKMLEVFHKED